MIDLLLVPDRLHEFPSSDLWSTEPMSRHFLRALEDLNKDVLTMGGAVEAQVARAVRAFLDRNVHECQSVIEGDRDINLQELRIDEECLKLLALYQPAARDLRFLTGTMKINNDLERVADLAVSVAERGIELGSLPSRETPPEFVEMAERARAMLTASLDALVRRDTARAQEVLRMDDPIDALLRSIFAAFEKDMAAHPDRIKSDLQILSASRNLERIADHATNIAEDVVYMVEGSIIRHMH